MMEGDVRKKGMLYQQQQRFGKVRFHLLIQLTIATYNLHRSAITLSGEVSNTDYELYGIPVN